MHKQKLRDMFSSTGIVWITIFMTMESVCNLYCEVIISHTVLVAKSLINQTDQRLKKKNHDFGWISHGEVLCGTDNRQRVLSRKLAFV